MKKGLLKVFVIISFLLITFFSVKRDYFAASFKYADFNWEEFLEQNKNYWVSGCDKDDDNCYDRIIKTQEKFHKRLYKLLAKFESKGFLIDDKIIIETVFYGLTPNTFKDPVDGEKNPFNLDDENDSSWIAEVSSDAAAKEYFEKETDSLKTLMNNMIGYTQACYGLTDEVPTTDSDGNKVCGDNLIVSQDGTECIAKLDNLSTTMFSILGIFKFTSDDEENESKCQELAKNYKGYRLGEISAKKEVNEKLYWDFLLTSTYFDEKDHLQTYYENILHNLGHEKMSELSEDEYLENEEAIKGARKIIINNIKSILESYKKYASDVSMQSSSSSAYWWPIGSAETTDSDGKIMAIGEPEFTYVSSYYGYRIHPVYKTLKKHNGIDIGGTEGKANIIASRDGTVVYVTPNNGSCVNGDSSCGGGYGNHIIIQHPDNNFTLYAHLYNGSINVNIGDVVTQGQVIAKMGTTGTSTGSHLHFEVRVGGNDNASAQDPLLFVDPENPRVISVQSQLVEWLNTIEGTGEIVGDSYKVYKDTGGVLTFGHGITVVNNKELIRSHDIDPDTLVEGSLIKKSIADQIYSSILQTRSDNIKTLISSKGLTLSQNQIDALVSLSFNTGNINSFFGPYQSYGSNQSLCDNWWHNYALHDANGTYQPGLKNRRKYECKLFVFGDYSIN